MSEASPGAVSDEGEVPPSAEISRCVEALVKRLPEPYAQALMLTELGGMTQKEAAAKVGLSVSGMKSRVQRGRGKLKELLLGCCDFELDRRRGIVDYATRGPDGCRRTCD